MSEYDENDEPGFDDPSYAEIRALLAEAQVTSPIPADVITSLDATLAGLVAERAGAETPAVHDADSTVVPLRRRSRLAPRLLVAAAAVVLLGAGAVGLRQVLHNSDTATSLNASARPQSTAAAPQAPVAEASTGTAGGTSGTGGTGSTGASGGTAGGSTNGGTPLAGNPPLVAGTLESRGNFYDALVSTRTRFSRAHFAAQASRYVSASNSYTWDRSANTSDGIPAPADTPTEAQKGAAMPPVAVTPSSGELAALGYRPTARCPGPTVTDGSLVVLITFEGHRATLVLHPESHGKRFVVAWSCNGSKLLDFATVTR